MVSNSKYVHVLGIIISLSLISAVGMTIQKNTDFSPHISVDRIGNSFSTNHHDGDHYESGHHDSGHYESGHKDSYDSHHEDLD